MRNVIENGVNRLCVIYVLWNVELEMVSFIVNIIRFGLQNVDINIAGMMLILIF